METDMKANLYAAVFLLLSGLSLPLSAQELLGDTKVKDFPTEMPWAYPYMPLDWNEAGWYIAHDPALQVGPGEFIHIYRPERSNERQRFVRKYNLYAEQVWEQKVELAFNEEFIHSYLLGDTLVLISSQFAFTEQQHYLRARKLLTEDGKQVEEKLMLFLSGASAHEILFEVSPDGKKMLAWRFSGNKPDSRPRLYYDYVRRDESPGYKAARVRKIDYVLFEQNLSRAREGSFTVSESPRTVWIDVRPDNKGNIFATGHEKHKGLIVLRLPLGASEPEERSWADFPKLSETRELYTLHFPAMITEQGALCVVRVDRTDPKFIQQTTRAFEIIRFDFDKPEAEVLRMDITSTLLVQMEKQREAAGFKPTGRFDKYLVHKVVEMPDHSLWFVAQRFEVNAHSELAEQGAARSHSEYRAGEVLLMGIDAAGVPIRMITIPTQRNISTAIESLGLLADVTADTAQFRMRILTTEPSEGRLRGPERLFYREADLITGKVSERVQVYEGKNRLQYIMPAYYVWLNEGLLAFVSAEGDDDDAHVVTVNLSGQKQEETDRKKKRVNE
ncbi:MAG: hypothetical protein EAZ89_15895 [Bacteroidetes bacterium]|nr:MAG: hypothetical protein EAZ89_15895 [Bacteroidota bacterium]